MKNIYVIFAREIQSFYVSPLYYILGFIYLALTGYFFTIEIYYSRLAVMENTMYNIGFFTILFLSILCMKLIAEERDSGTFELIMTAPITSLQYVIGKYLSVLVVYGSLLIMTFVYPILLMIFGKPDMGVIFSGYLGLFLLGTAILGLGLIATSVSKSQLVAAILGVSMGIFAYIINWLSEMFTGASKLLNAISITTYFADFTKGMIDIQNVIFFLIWAIACISISTMFVESYKWQ